MGKKVIFYWLSSSLMMSSWLFISGCDSDSGEKPNLDYFPLQKGFYQIYTVDQTIYSEVETPQHSNYQLMLEVVDSIAAAEGGFTYVLYRSTRPTESGTWKYLDTWSARKNGLRIVVTEGNSSFVKIALPATKGRTWDGNAYNNLDEDDYEVEAANVEFSIDGDTYQDALIINQSDNQDFIVYLDQRTEVYGPGVGLIHKETTQLRYCTIDPNCVGQQQVLDGIEYSQSLLEYGYR